jgi:hypothetical protein
VEKIIIYHYNEIVDFIKEFSYFICPCYCHDITEILLKVALSTITLTHLSE